ncbi:type II secretion system GspH family protein [Mycoplasmatota bacterium]|nr:type II secretion system GspH family protein [Mycoplasmatota bacterium]
MNKKGMTIVELLAVLVIMAIVASLVALLISTYQSVNQDISDESKANIESSLLFQSIRNDIHAFSPTDYDECVEPNCIILVKTFQYIVTDDDIVLDTFEQVETMTLEIDNQTILFNNQAYRIEYFSIGQASNIVYNVNGNTIEIEINLVLESNDNSYYFTMTHSYDIKEIPV